MLWQEGPAHLLVQKGALLDDKALKSQLAARPLEQAPLHAVRSCQPQHQHRFVLANAVAPVHCLSQIQFCVIRI